MLRSPNFMGKGGLFLLWGGPPKGEKRCRARKTLCVVLLFRIRCPFYSVPYGQATASFSGTVSDKAGAVVSGANIKITSQATGFTRDAKTDDSGHYIVPLLPVGFYTIHVDAQGFGPAEQKDVRLQVDEQRELDFSLQPASVSTRLK